MEIKHEIRSRRLLVCVDAWPECETGKYDPRCCRFPKSCSCTIYDEKTIDESDLEDLMVTPEDSLLVWTVCSSMHCYNTVEVAGSIIDDPAHPPFCEECKAKKEKK